MELISATSEPRSRNLVFTSAGDRSNLRGWLEGRRDFDLWVAYYGAVRDTYREESDFYVAHKGSKFQNLHYCYQRWPDVFKHYDAVMVMDDDILIDATGISRLFAIRLEFDLWALQPAFRVLGKVSWDITRVHPRALLRFTNFIEMACPLFRRDKLDAFMAVYDPELVGYGIDWWFLHVMGDVGRHVAVVDAVTCINPYDRSKGGVREIDRLQSHAKRQEVWERMKALHGLDEQGREHKDLGHINQPLLHATRGLIVHSADRTYVYVKRRAAKLVRAVLSRWRPTESKDLS